MTEMTYQPDNKEFEDPVSMLLGTDLFYFLGFLILSFKMKAPGKMVCCSFPVLHSAGRPGNSLIE